MPPASTPPTEPWERVSVLVPYRLRIHMKEFQFQNYIQNRGEVVRRLIRSGLLYEYARGNYQTDESIPDLDAEVHDKE